MCSSPFGFQVCLHLDAFLSSESDGFMSAVFPPKGINPTFQNISLGAHGSAHCEENIIFSYINLFIVPGIVLAVEE